MTGASRDARTLGLIWLRQKKSDIESYLLKISPDARMRTTFASETDFQSLILVMVRDYFLRDTTACKYKPRLHDI